MDWLFNERRNILHLGDLLELSEADMIGMLPQHFIFLGKASAYRSMFEAYLIKIGALKCLIKVLREPCLQTNTTMKQRYMNEEPCIQGRLLCQGKRFCISQKRFCEMMKDETYFTWVCKGTR